MNYWIDNELLYNVVNDNNSEWLCYHISVFCISGIQSSYNNIFEIIIYACINALNDFRALG